PGQRLEQATQRLDIAEQTLARAIDRSLADFRQRIGELDSQVRRHRPDQVLALHRQRLVAAGGALVERFSQQLRARKDRVTRAADMLRLLSPEHTIARGYSITSTAEGKVVRTVGDVESGNEIHTRLRDGKIVSIVKKETATPAKKRRGGS
ncbi:MAG: exodeoxyribonuclease VII large subunit, partial [Chthoniobacteraceae bacterium]